MKLRYHAETDSLRIKLLASNSGETRAISGIVNVDLDAAGVVVGVAVDDPSGQLDLTTLINSGLSLQGDSFMAVG